MLRSAPRQPADEFVLDLEDSVPADGKDAARDRVIDALRSEAWAGLTVSVRVNPPRTPWCHLDIAALAAVDGPLGSIVVPKIQNAGDVAFIERLLDGVEMSSRRTRPLGVQALIETAAGVAHLSEIAGASDRLQTLIVGYADLAASLGRSRTGAADPDVWRVVQEQVLLAARANGLQAIDGPYLGVRADAGFIAAVERAHAAGFDGKWAIHPSQLQALNDAFTPTPDELTHAHRVLDALSEAEKIDGAGAVALDGQMLDEAIRVGALRTLARAGETA
jgi:citrate lyase subunit beta/citryl-CoA lyase